MTSTQRRVRGEVFDVPCWVDTVEDTILAKLCARQESGSDVQWRDCVELAATNDLDREHLRTWADRLGVRNDLESLLDSTDAAGRG